MSRYRHDTSILDSTMFMTDGGLETTLVFHDGIELPAFAAFDLLKSRQGEERLREYYERYAMIAFEHGMGMLLESPTWRANTDWGKQLGYSDIALDAINQQSIELLESIRLEHASDDTPMIISGCIGPRDDGYDPAAFMTAAEAHDYHTRQIATFAGTTADIVSALTITYVEEAIGIVRAAQQHEIPVVISFTVETDGRLPSGQALRAAIEQTDAETDAAPLYYMINCAHPTHFDDVLHGDDWLDRIRGIRANASSKSHAELDESTELDAGDPAELASQYSAFTDRLSNLAVVGGCCGTDHHHIEQICTATHGARHAA